MTEIQGKLILVQVSACCEFVRAQVSGSWLYFEVFNSSYIGIQPQFTFYVQYWKTNLYGPFSFSEN